MRIARSLQELLMVLKSWKIRYLGWKSRRQIEAFYKGLKANSKKERRPRLTQEERLAGGVATNTSESNAGFKTESCCRGTCGRMVTVIGPNASNPNKEKKDETGTISGVST